MTGNAPFADLARARPAAVLAVGAAAAGTAGLLAATQAAPAALAGGLVVIGVLAGVARPPVGLALLAAAGLLAPFLVVPVRIGAQPPVVDALLAAVIAGTAVRILAGRRIRAPGWLWIGLGAQVVLTAAAILAAWPGSGDVEAVQYGVKLMLAATAPLWLLACWRRDRIWRIAPALVTLAVALQSVLAIGLHLAAERGAGFLAALAPAGYPAEEIRRFLPDQITARATGTLVDPNVLGVTLAAALPFVLAWTFSGARPRRAGMLVLVLVLVALGLSLSRGGWLAAGAAVAGWLVWRHWRLAGFMALAGALLILLPLPVPGLTHLRAGFVGADPSSALRLDEFRNALTVIGRYPWLGVGFGDPPHPDVFAGVSNAWLWIAERAGLLAAAASLSVLAGALIGSARVAARDDLARTAFASLLAVAVAGLFDHHVASFPHLLMLVGLVVALAVGARAASPRAA